MIQTDTFTPIDATLTQAGVPADSKTTGDAISELQALVGDTPVSEQISAALYTHDHNDYVSREDFNELKKIVMQLCDMMGDTAVSEQISTAFSGLNAALLEHNINL